VLRLPAALAVLGCAAACAGPSPRPVEPVVLRVGSVPASETTPLPLPAWRDDEVAPVAQWPKGCAIFKESDATRILPQTSHQSVEEFDLEPPVIRRPGSTDRTYVPFPGGECRRSLWLADSQPGDAHDALIWTSPIFAGGAALARVNHEFWAQASEPCPATIDRRVVTDCAFDPDFGDYVARRNGVVVTFMARIDIDPDDRWAGQRGAGRDAYVEFWQQEVVPRFVNAVMARIP
jgi:hypothetical protein